jgi:uncharacterized repeat protein (TIGR02543 family)
MSVKTAGAPRRGVTLIATLAALAAALASVNIQPAPAFASTATISAAANNCQVQISSDDVPVESADATEVTLVGSRCVVKFKAVGRYSVTIPAGVDSLDYLVVGGGGGGGSGGGGGGGVLQGSNYSVSSGSPYDVAVGDGGQGGSGGVWNVPVNSTPGQDSSFDTVVALGGGSGGQGNQSAGQGASGGGSQYDCTDISCAGTGTAGQGSNGAASTHGGYGGGAGGGGAGGAGGNTVLYHIGGKGGDGLQSSITGVATYYGGGGGGGINSNDSQYCGLNYPGTSDDDYFCTDTPVTSGGGDGGLGGGGKGSSWGYTAGNPGDISMGGFANGSAGAANTGGGGGGVDPEDAYAYAGGSGIVVISFISPANFRSLNFESNNGSGLSTTQNIQSGVPTALQANTFTYTGYVFQGWNTAADGSGTSYTNLANYTTNSAATLFAQWRAGVTHTVTFDPNNGTGTQAPQVAGQSTSLSQNQFSRAGYTFAGWSTSASGSGYSYPNQAVYSFASDVRLYAQWAQVEVTYTVTFYGNGATSGSTAGQTASSTRSLNLNGFSRIGYNFLGWSQNNWDSSASYLDGQSYPFDANLSLYAIWVPQATNEITFDGNGSSSGSMANETADSSTVLSANAYQKAGHTFLYWNTAADGSGVSYRSNYTYSFAQSITLYAIWGQNFAISYSGNGNTGGSAPSNQASYVGGSLQTLRTNTGELTKTGYLLAGWNSAADGTGTSYALGQTNVALSNVVTLYAQWAGATYVVLYTANGSTAGLAPTSQNYTYGSSGITIRLNSGNLARTGYVFAGWNTAPDAMGIDYAAGTTGRTFSQDTVMFAKWTPLQSSISYNYNGSTGGDSTAGLTFSTGDSALLLPSPIKTGYSFGGWYSDAGLTSRVGSAGTAFTPDTSNSSISLYAKWVLATYTLTYLYEGADSGNVASSASYTTGDPAVALPSPHRTHFQFDGWFDASSGGNLVGAAGATLTLSSSRSLYAHWTQDSLVGLGASTNISHITVTNGLGNQYTVTGSSNSVSVDLSSGALPDGTTLDIFLRNDPASARSLISGTNSFIVSLVVSWLALDGTVPTTASGKPIIITITNAAIKAGAAIYQVIGGIAQFVGNATQNGSAQVAVTDDPELVVAATLPTEPTGVAATVGDASAQVTWFAPTSSGGADITSYLVTASSGQTCTSSALTCNMVGLTNGTAVTFTVQALNAVGASTSSTSSVSVTPVVTHASAPSTPSVQVSSPTPTPTPSPTSTPTPTPQPSITSAPNQATKVLAGFAPNSAALSATTKKALLKLVATLGKAKAITVAGIASSAAATPAAAALAQSRAKNVLAFLKVAVRRPIKTSLAKKAVSATRGQIQITVVP